MLLILPEGERIGYGDPWNVDIVQKWVDDLADDGIRIFSLSDTIGVSNPENIAYLFQNLVPKYPDVEFGAHLHTTPTTWREKIEAAHASGCRRFDGALRGFGGCPMAKDELTGNMATENMVAFFDEIGLETGLDRAALNDALRMVSEIFPH